jgi:plasmid stabilization system protein ParE
VPARFSVEITPSAEAEIAEIWDYVAQDSPANAEALILALEEQITSLEKCPERCSRIPENEILWTSYRHLLHGAYRTICRIIGSRVIILRVIHGARLLDTSFFIS